jgi:hypothetical protein
MRITNHEAPHYAVFSILLSLPPLRLKYLPEHPVLVNPQFTFLPFSKTTQDGTQQLRMELSNSGWNSTTQDGTPVPS